MQICMRKSGKRLLALLLTVLLVVTCLPFAAMADSTAKTTEYVNLRSGPSTSYSSKTVLSLGATVTVTDTSNPEWYAVKTSSGMTGYIFSKYLSMSSGSGGGSASGTSAKTNEYVNLRSGPSTSYSSKTVLASGTPVTVTDTSNSEWYAVTTSNGTTGYIFSKYITMDAGSGGSGGSADGVTAKTTTGVNLRSGPSTSYSSKGVLATGTSVTVTDRSNSEWFAVKTSSGATGYIFSIYLKITSEGGGTATPTPTPTPTPPPASGSVQGKTTTDVNLRRGAGTTFGVITVLDTNTSFEITEATNDQWVKVKLSNGTEGYLFKEYVQVTSGDLGSLGGSTSTPTPTPPSANGEVKAVTTTDVNLRSGPATTFKVLDILDTNVAVTVTEATNSTWYKVKLSNGTEGYISAQYLKITSGDINSVKPEDKPEEEDPSDGNSPTTGEYVRTTTGVNLREKATTDSKVLTVLNTGTVLDVIDRKTSGWVHVRTSGGKEGYVSEQYTVIYDPSSSNASISATSATLAQYRTLYLSASTSGQVNWVSSDTSVATVSAGVSGQLFVYGAKPGTAKIMGQNVKGDTIATCTVTVTGPEAVRFAYTEPNVINAGSSFSLVAVTDANKTGVKFEIDGVGTYETTTYDSETQGINTIRAFKASASISTPGLYTVRAYSSTGSGYSSDYREFTILVVSTFDATSSSNESRRVSDEMLANIASYEGYLPTVYPDKLAGNIPTVGYGYVVSKNTSFYNDLTKREAKAMLADTVNRGSYTSEVNKFISNNGLYMSQSQFDALASFSYNVGAGYWNNTSMSCYLRTVLLNTVVPPSNLSASNAYAGKTTSNSLRVYSDHSASASKVSELVKGTAVNIIGYYQETNTHNTWYQITFNGKTGWARAGDIAFQNTSGLKRDLNYVDAHTFGSNMLDWHRAGDSCYIGLYYRRLAESKVFSYANYSEASPSSGSYKVNTYGLSIPSCL